LVGFHYNHPWDFYMIGFLFKGNLARWYAYGDD